MPIQETERKRSKYTGVVWNKDSHLWKARIMVNGKMHHLGYFHDETEAAKAYDEAIVNLRQEALKLNFPLEDEKAA